MAGCGNPEELERKYQAKIDSTFDEPGYKGWKAGVAYCAGYLPDNHNSFYPHPVQPHFACEEFKERGWIERFVEERRSQGRL